jgi:hypothetical protein
MLGGNPVDNPGDAISGRSGGPPDLGEAGIVDVLRLLPLRISVELGRAHPVVPERRREIVRRRHDEIVRGKR